jgi:hypothetical protein
VVLTHKRLLTNRIPTGSGAGKVLLMQVPELLHAASKIICETLLKFNNGPFSVT